MKYESIWLLKRESKWDVKKMLILKSYCHVINWKKIEICVKYKLKTGATKCLCKKCSMFKSENV